ncbi:MAG: helix-turn-helix domain-containing protein [Polyangiales bacterium]
MESAARVLARRGFEAFTTNEVAELAGVAIGSLYEYFPTKQVLVAEVVRRELAAVTEELRAVSYVDARPLRERLEAWVRVAADALGRRAKLTRVIWTQVPFLWELDEVRALPLHLVQLSRAMLVNQRESWVADDPDASAYVMMVMVRAALLESVIALPDSLSQERVQRTLVNVLEQLLT